ncbi:MAG: hypothetical protein WCL13_02770 [bacterium]
MSQELNKEIADNLMAMPGEARGVVLKTDGDYVLKEKGEAGLKKLEEELSALSCSIDYKKVKTLSFYPIGLRVISLLAIKKVFSLSDDKIKELGAFASRTSLMVKFFINYFLSVEKVFFNEAPRIWRKHWSIGELIPVELNEEKKYAIIQIKNFKLHPIFCLYLGGYFCGTVQMLVKSAVIDFEETKCSFSGGEYHEYTIKWK